MWDLVGNPEDRFCRDVAHIWHTKQVINSNEIFLTKCMKLTAIRDVSQGPVVQSIVNLTTSLRRQLVKYMPTKLSNTLLFFVEKM